MKTSAVFVSAVLLLASLGIFFQSRLASVSTASSPAAVDKSANIFAQTKERSGANEPSEAVFPRAEVTVSDRSLPMTTAGNKSGGASAEVELPAAPTGDYELNLSPEQLAGIVEKRYGPLLRTLPLPTDRLARFRSLLTERQQASVDAANAALLVGMNPVRETAAIRLAIDSVQEPVDATLRAEFGAAIFSAYREYDQTLGERNAVEEFSRSLVVTGETLRPEQEKQLVQILKSGAPRSPGETIDRAIYGATDVRAPVTEKAVAAAARVLSPHQLAEFRKLQQP